MAHIKYFYNTKTCKYERARRRPTDWAINVLAFLVVSSLLGTVFAFSYTRLFGSPEVLALRKHNQELQQHYEVINRKAEEVSAILNGLQTRDDNIYRVIFEADPIPASVRTAGIGGAERYQDLLNRGMQKDELVISTLQRLDHLKKQMYIQSKSHDEIARLIEDKKQMLAAIPAIRPIRTKDLKAMASGFGRRIDPIYKTVKMHHGMDFSARTGTKIHATGEGVVELARQNGGYGQCVVIDHGYGYKTLYGHMHEVLVKAGQKVKRGDVIGKVGSTGKSTGPHLHYEVVKNGKKVNPINFYYNDLAPHEYEEMVQLVEHSNQSLD